MAIKREYDSGVPLQYVFQQAAANPEFEAFFGRDEDGELKIYEQINVPPKSDRFVFITVSEEQVDVRAGVNQYIGQISVDVELIHVRKYATAQGSERDFSKAIQVLNRVFCGAVGVEVFFTDEATGETEKIGLVEEASYLQPTALYNAPQGNFDVLHKGIRFHVKWL